MAANTSPMIRILRSAAGEIHGVARAATTTHRRLRDRLVFIAIATVGIDLICAVLAYLTERNTQQSDIKGFSSALFWTSTQLLTVSSSFKNPTSAGGRVLDVLMEAYAITVIATLAGAVGSFFQKRGEERAEEDAATAIKT